MTFADNVKKKTNRVLLATLALLVTSLVLTAPSAQQTAPVAAKQSQEDRIALYQALLDLTNPWTVMCIAAHPDDEDGTSLIVMRRKYGAHTVSLFSTFGEGGQNAIGPELYEELGAIRARETMAAAEIQGSEPYFLGLKDFGYSKSADEAFRVWGHDQALRRMVLQIRKIRPDVIITNHSVTNNDHGHHQATARLELEAFDAAADPKRFPEQLKDGVTVWQVQRLFVRARSNQAQADNPQLVTIDPNDRDINRNTTFAEEALSALQKHATQGPWPKTVAQMAARFTNSSDGRLPLIRYRLVREATGAEPLTKDADSFLAGLVIPREMQPRLVPWNPDDSWISLNEREQVLPKLLVMAKAFHQKNSPQDIMAMPAVAALDKKLNAAIAAASGISVNVVPEASVLVPGTPANFDITVTNHGSVEVQLFEVMFDGMGLGSGRPSSTRALAPGQSAKIVREFKTPADATVTVPHQEHLYDRKTFGEKFTATVVVSTKGGSFQVPGAVSVDVAPPVEMRYVGTTPIVITPQTKTVGNFLQFSLVNHTRIALGQSIQTLAKFGATEALQPISESPFRVEPNTKAATILRELELSQLSIRTNGNGFTADTPRVTLLFRLKGIKPEPEISVPIIYADAHVTQNLYLGYVRGFDYSLLHTLDALGVASKELSVDDVKTTDLSKFSTIIVDNRVYESQPELTAANQRLLDYAKDGGTLIVFYHKSFEWNPDERRKRPQLAPYKLILGDERITDENAPITFLEPQHPLLNSPNKINQEDFVGWIQERGLYYPKDWDPQYHALLQSNDPGEAPLKGGLLVADYGRGHYIYSSMVWYRQLRAGVPGAYRMLANMISYGRGK